MGDPIDCHANGGSVKEDMLDTYCWIEGTFTKRRIGGEDVDPEEGYLT